jgi:hypothetical protein
MFNLDGITEYWKTAELIGIPSLEGVKWYSPIKGVYHYIGTTAKPYGKKHDTRTV